MSVMVSVLSVSFKAAVCVVAGMGLLMLYIQYGKK
jgi:hypothetical protein